jgi:hypothetical protein
MGLVQEEAVRRRLLLLLREVVRDPGVHDVVELQKHLHRHIL